VVHAGAQRHTFPLIVGPSPSAYKPLMARPDRRPRHPGGNRQKFPPRSPTQRHPETLWIYGIHAVAAALANPRRDIRRIVATKNALARLAAAGATLALTPEEATPAKLDQILGGDAVHQGIALEAAPLPPATLDSLAGASLIVVLDQVTDPHNVGAVFRSAAAFGADALVTTARHAPTETGVLAKAASGALDTIPWLAVPNLARAMDEIGNMGFTRVGLDSAAERPIEEAITGRRIALVLGAEDKGLRRLTREKCDVVARLSVPGAIASLNVSNAAVLALYLARRHFDGV